MRPFGEDFPLISEEDFLQLPLAPGLPFSYPLTTSPRIASSMPRGRGMIVITASLSGFFYFLPLVLPIRESIKIHRDYWVITYMTLG